MNHDFQHMSECVYQDMSLPSLHFFARIIPTFSTYLSCFHTLTIHNRCTWMGAALDFPPYLVAQCPVYSLPCPILTPLVIMVVHTVVVGKLTRQVFPLNPRFVDIQDSIHYLTHI